jgi:hypothetical protein
MSVIADSVGTATARRDAAGRADAPLLALRHIPPAAWDDLAAGFSGVCQEQLFAFASRRWPGPTHEPVAFVGADGACVGGALMMVQRLPFGLGQVAFVKWAPMLADTASPEAAGLYAGMVDALCVEYAQKRGMMLSIMPAASPLGENSDYAALMARGFRPGVLLNYPLRYFVDLRQDDRALRAGLEPHWRRQLGKAEKAGLTFTRAHPGRLGEFTALYERMLARKRFADYSAYETVPQLLALGNEKLRPELFFVSAGGEVVAGAIIFKAGERATYLYGATLDAALPLRAGYFLHWHIMRWLRDNSAARWYDLGGSDGFAGLHQFKKGMTGAAGAVTPVPRTANYAESGFTLFIGSAALWLREALQEVRRRLSRLRPDRAQPTLRRHVTSPDRKQR